MEEWVYSLTIHNMYGPNKIIPCIPIYFIFVP